MYGSPEDESTRNSAPAKMINKHVSNQKVLSSIKFEIFNESETRGVTTRNNKGQNGKMEKTNKDTVQDAD